ncbi:Hypothetical_protein [Hexamita inflata]|uniref:Hypothetical_protein n=1 Tax=Hexamita inflata TaxID=28002 RepID=A0ABP1JIV8_9EUKA
MLFMKCLISLDSFITACALVVRTKKTCVRQTGARVRDYTSIVKVSQQLTLIYILQNQFWPILILLHIIITNILIVLTQHPKSPFPHAQLRAVFAHNTRYKIPSLDGSVFSSALIINSNDQFFSSICFFNVCLYFQSISFLIHDSVIMAPHGASSDSNYLVNCQIYQYIILYKSGYHVEMGISDAE